jgi:hypothetical protein
MSRKNDSSLIKPQLYIQFQQLNFRIDPIPLKMLNAYAEFIQSDNSYVIREAFNYLFSEDAAFCQWLDTRDKKKDEPLSSSAS